MRAAALEPSEGAAADSAAEVQNLQTIAEPVKTQPTKRYAAIPSCAPNRAPSLAAWGTADRLTAFRRSVSKAEGSSDRLQLFGPDRPDETFTDDILQIDVIGTDALRPDR